MPPVPPKRKAYDYAERIRDGRIELFIDRLIPGGDSLETGYRYRLPANDKPPSPANKETK